MHITKIKINNKFSLLQTIKYHLTPKTTPKQRQTLKSIQSNHKRQNRDYRLNKAIAY